MISFGLRWLSHGFPMVSYRLSPVSSCQKNRHESQSLRLLAAARLHVLITGCGNGLIFWSALVPARALDAPSTPCAPWVRSCNLQLNEHPPKAHWGIAAFQRTKTYAKPKVSSKCAPRLGHTGCTKCPALPLATVGVWLLCFVFFLGCSVFSRSAMICLCFDRLRPFPARP